MTHQLSRSTQSRGRTVSGAYGEPHNEGRRHQSWHTADDFYEQKPCGRIRGRHVSGPSKHSAAIDGQGGFYMMITWSIGVALVAAELALIVVRLRRSASVNQGRR